MGEEEPEPERELPLQPRKPRKIQALKGILSTAISKVGMEPLPKQHGSLTLDAPYPCILHAALVSLQNVHYKGMPQGFTPFPS